MRVLNTATGLIEHPHPLFKTWGQQVARFVSKYQPYVARDSWGTPFCGRVGDPSKPAGKVLLAQPR